MRLVESLHVSHVRGSRIATIEGSPEHPATEGRNVALSYLRSYYSLQIPPDARKVTTSIGKFTRTCLHTSNGQSPLVVGAVSCCWMAACKHTEKQETGQQCICSLKRRKLQTTNYHR